MLWAGSQAQAPRLQCPILTTCFSQLPAARSRLPGPELSKAGPRRGPWLPSTCPHPGSPGSQQPPRAGLALPGGPSLSSTKQVRLTAAQTCSACDSPTAWAPPTHSSRPERRVETSWAGPSWHAAGLPTFPVCPDLGHVALAIPTGTTHGRQRLKPPLLHHTPCSPRQRERFPSEPGLKFRAASSSRVLILAASVSQQLPICLALF